MVVVSALVLGNTLANDFIWDDQFLITEHQAIQRYGNIPLFFTPHYWNAVHPYQGHYRPLRAVSFALDYVLWGLNPAGYHATNSALHIINVVLVFFVVSIIVESIADKGYEKGARRKIPLHLPFLTALLFATHPVHSESINIIKNRSDLMAFSFFLLSLLLFVKHFSASARLSRRLLLIGSCFCCIPAILSKEMALTLPGVLALYVVCFLTGQDRGKALIKIIPYGIIIVIYLWFMHSFITPAVNACEGFPVPADITQHALTVIKTTVFYLRMLVVPYPLNIDHTFQIPKSAQEISVVFAFSLLLLTGITAFGAVFRQKIIFFSIGWTFLTIIPVANIIYLACRPIAEQRLYIPSLGVCLLLAFCLERLSNFRIGRLNKTGAVLISVLMTGAIVSLYAGMSVHRNLQWRNGISIYSDSLADNPANARIHFNLGVALYDARRYEEAVEHYRASLNLQPASVDAYYNLGIALYSLGYYEEAIKQYQNVLQLKPDHIDAHFNLGLAFYRTDSPEKAIRHYRIVLELEPDHIEALNNLGLLLNDVGRREDALDLLQDALGINPDNAQTNINIGEILSDMGRFEEAAGHYATALRIRPDFLNAYLGLGKIFRAQGKTNKAIHIYAAALALYPDNAIIHYELGNALAQDNQPDKALYHYVTALRLNPHLPKIDLRIGDAVLGQNEPEKVEGTLPAD